MPVLRAEPDMHPETLWDDSPPTVAEGRRWWCLHARPRQEKAAARAFRTQGLSYYLPQVSHSYRTPGGRALRSVLPLFPGYLFLLGDDRERVEAMKGGHLANVLDVPDQEALVGDLLQVHRMIASGLPIVPEPSHVVGARVRILSGPLQGLEGTVVRSGKKDRVVAMVRFLGGGATVDLDGWDLEAIEG